MKRFLGYIKENRYALYGVTGVGAIFALVFYFYSVNVAAALYPLVLSFAYLLILFFIKYAKVNRRHKDIENLKKLPAVTVVDNLPVGDYLLEKDYIELLSEKIAEMEEALGNFEKSERDMKDYYAMWAHQIKTPIASMRLALQGKDSKEARLLLGNLKSIEGYVDMVMTYIRLNSEHTDYVIKEENIRKLVNETVRKFSVDFIEKKLSLSVDVPEVNVLTDKKWILIVLEQIVSNAIKYTYNGGITIKYDNESNMLTITDTGIGIDPENLPRIFENGYTGFNGRGEAHSSGIGLYISKKIATELSVDIKCDSVVNVGTTMCLTFPKAGRIYE